MTSPSSQSSLSRPSGLQSGVFEDLVADFIIEEKREPDLLEMAHFARAIHRYSLEDTL